MEQFIKGYEIGGEGRVSANCAADLVSDMNGQIETTSIVSYEKSGGSYVVSAIVNMTKRNLGRTKLGIKGYSDGNRGWIQRAYLKPLGTKELRVAKKFRAGIAEQSFTRQKEAHGFVENRARCSAIKGLIYLLENKLITI